MVKDQLTESKAAYESLTFRITSEILNSISMTSAFLVICAIAYLRTYHKKVSNRVSLRLQTFVSTADMLFAAFQIMTVNSNPPGNWVCHVSPWGFVFSALLGCFFSVTIAFNLQIIFVYNYLSTRHFEKYYVIIPLILALTLSIVPVLFDALGYDQEEVRCWYKHGNTTRSIIWQFATLHGWIILSVLYCTYAVVTIIYRLRQANKFITEMNRSFPNTNSRENMKNRAYKRQLMINQAVKRIVIYPIVPIITFAFNIVSNLIFFTTQENPFEFQMLANVGTSSQGLFNAVAFCFDPAMKKVWKRLFRNLPWCMNDDDENFSNNNYSYDKTPIKEKKSNINNYDFDDDFKFDSNINSNNNFDSINSSNIFVGVGNDDDDNNTSNNNNNNNNNNDLENNNDLIFTSMPNDESGDERGDKVLTLL